MTGLRIRSYDNTLGVELRRDIKKGGDCGSTTAEDGSSTGGDSSHPAKTELEDSPPTRRNAKRVKRLKKEPPKYDGDTESTYSESRSPYRRKRTKHSRSRSPSLKREYEESRREKYRKREEDESDHSRSEKEEEESEASIRRHKKYRNRKKEEDSDVSPEYRDLKEEDSDRSSSEKEETPVQNKRPPQRHYRPRDWAHAVREERQSIRLQKMRRRRRDRDEDMRPVKEEEDDNHSSSTHRCYKRERRSSRYRRRKSAGSEQSRRTKLEFKFVAEKEEFSDGDSTNIAETDNEEEATQCPSPRDLYEEPTTAPTPLCPAKEDADDAVFVTEIVSVEEHQFDDDDIISVVSADAIGGEWACEDELQEVDDEYVDVNRRRRCTSIVPFLQAGLSYTIDSDCELCSEEEDDDDMEDLYFLDDETFLETLNKRDELFHQRVKRRLRLQEKELLRRLKTAHAISCASPSKVTEDQQKQIHEYQAGLFERHDPDELQAWLRYAPPVSERRLLRRYRSGSHKCPITV